ncbi:APC family permease [Candidatus Dependentiae bacterium]
MSKKQTISLAAAVMININIMLGAGVFLNTVKLSPAGALGSLAYLIAGAMMLPLVLTIAKLTGMHPSGGFYAFGKNELHPFAGFISAWSYFIGKLASGALMIHFSLSLIQQLIGLGSVPILVLDAIAIGAFISLNMLNVKAGSRIQVTFTFLKLIPIIFAILTGLYLFQGSNVTAVHRVWSEIPPLLPLLFYATMGFEAACLLCNKIENAQRNAPRAILISYGITLTIVAIYQLVFYGALGTMLTNLVSFNASYLYPFPALLQKLLPASPALAVKIKSILHLALASSALGGAYGIMFSNTWNLHTLAKNNHLFFSNVFTWLNRHAIPVACVFVEGAIYATYLLVSSGTQIVLQQLSSLGVVLAYTMSVIALMAAKIKRPNIPVSILLPVFGLISCTVFIGTSISGLIKAGLPSLLTFSTLLILGALMFVATGKKGKTC